MIDYNLRDKFQSGLSFDQNHQANNKILVKLLRTEKFRRIEFLDIPNDSKYLELTQISPIVKRQSNLNLVEPLSQRKCKNSENMQNSFTEKLSTNEISDILKIDFGVEFFYKFLKAKSKFKIKRTHVCQRTKNIVASFL